MDYSKLSDQEINMAVAEIFHPDSVVIESKSRPPSACITGHLPSKWVDYCNNPSDAWPIIEKYRISFLDQLTEWCVDVKGVSPVFEANPLRGAMIVFLMMQEVSQCSG
ncbi:phage protein NinX family protein [Citrobacter freundii]|nr:phage protein NinX family protein [Citrobacter freundii]MEB0340302.1 phage protein NinX family protein [Citrobacter freundii]MEB0370826.1 phage protein NinX family protein [Citrobacter freundii]MEB0375120.1 phage protein NinX family protein [Citrobacter freundii]